LKQKLGLPDKKIAVFVGRIDSGKRVDFLIDTFTSCIQQYPNVHLIIIGDGPERVKIKSMVNDNITLLGTVDNVNEYLMASDLLVSPTLAEGMSNVILEAMSTGLPVITTNVCSNPEIITNGINGILLDIHDKDGFVKNMVQLLSDYDLASAMATSARKAVENRFSIKKVAENYLALFRKILEE
jgi:glycosyltransferase involved in cell wall biosynthesis